jgi:hypothetical protein
MEINVGGCSFILCSKDRSKGWRNGLSADPAACALASRGKASSPEFRQGNTSGRDNRHWLRAKFRGKYRLFYRFSTEHKIIVYAWVNDEGSLRKSSAKTDLNAVFKAMLESGNPRLRGRRPERLRAATIRACRKHQAPCGPYPETTVQGIGDAKPVRRLQSYVSQASII